MFVCVCCIMDGSQWLRPRLSSKQTQKKVQECSGVLSLMRQAEMENVMAASINLMTPYDTESRFLRATGGWDEI